MAELIKVERAGSITVLKINRPDQRNCIDADTAAQMRAAFDEIEADDGCAAVILTGEGDISFSAGLDLKQLAAQGPDLIPNVIFEDTGWGGIAQRNFPKPLIAAVNGFAIAGGLELMLSCDFAIASERAQFGFNEVTLGPIADAGATFRLPKWVPLPYAREMLLTGKIINAQEAFRIGLVNRVVPHDRLLDACFEIGEVIARNSRSSLKITKSLIAETLWRHEDEAWEINNRYMRASFESPDFMEGPRAFTEKRTAEFQK